MSTKHNRRTQVLIDLPVQLGVTLRLLALWAVTTLLTAATGVLLNYFSNPTTSLLSHLATPASWMPSLIAFVLVLPIATLHLMRFTHRFAGPVYRLRSELQALAAGKPRRPLKFRKGDFWTGMAEDFNAVAEQLREQRRSNPAGEDFATETAELVAAGEEA